MEFHSGEILSLAFDALPQAIALLGPGGEILLANSAFRSTIPASENQGPAPNWPDLAKQHFQPVAGQLPLLRKGERLYRPTDVSLAHGQSLLCLEDVTEAESQRRQQVNFIQVASHDLRNPISVTRSYGSLLRDQKTGLSETRLRYAEVIIRNADRALSLLQDVTDSALCQLTELELDNAPAELLPLVDRALKLAVASIGEEEVRIEASLPTSLPKVQVDSTRLVRVVLACLQHATSRAPPGAVVHLEVTMQGPRVYFAVTDPSPPPGPSELPEYFDQARSVQVEGKLGPRFRLSLAKAVVEALGGKLGFQPLPQGGTALGFSLPSIPEIKLQP